MDEAHHGFVAILGKAIKSFGTQAHEIVERLQIGGVLLDYCVRDGFVLEIGNESLAVAQNHYERLVVDYVPFAGV